MNATMAFLAKEGIQLETLLKGPPPEITYSPAAVHEEPGDKPWEHYKQKTASFLYLCIGTECRRIFKSEHSHFQIEKEPLRKFGE